MPFIAYSRKMRRSGRMDDVDTFAVIGAPIAENFEVQMPAGTVGHSILEQLL